MSTELSQAIFFGLLVETILAIIALRYPDKRKQVVILMICTVIVGVIAYGQQVVAAIIPSPEPTMTSTPSTLTNPITHIYDDFNNPANDGKIDKSRWSVSDDHPNTCDVSQKSGYLVIGHKPSSSDNSGCFLSGPLEGVSGSSFKLFEAKAFVLNDFQGVCCSAIQLVLASNGFSGGGGYIVCAIDPGPGFIAGVFAVNNNGNVSEYRSQVDTTYNDWHTLRLEINQSDYKVSCYIDNNLIGSVIPKDAATLYVSTFSRYIQANWAKDTSVTFQLDDVKIIP